MLTLKTRRIVAMIDHAMAIEELRKNYLIILQMRCNMKFFIGDNLRLAGKTRHGKNRIRENGDLWEVTNLDGQDSSILSTKICGSNKGIS